MPFANFISCDNDKCFIFPEKCRRNTILQVQIKHNPKDTKNVYKQGRKPN